MEERKEMENKIIIAADETIVCPKCHHNFPLDQGITRHTIERYENEFAEAYAQRKTLEESLAKEASRTQSDQAVHGPIEPP